MPAAGSQRPGRLVVSAGTAVMPAGIDRSTTRRNWPFWITSFWFGPEIAGSVKLPSGSVNVLGVAQSSNTHSAQ
jgi:hypothetical protein